MRRSLHPWLQPAAGSVFCEALPFWTLRWDRGSRVRSGGWSDKLQISYSLPPEVVYVHTLLQELYNKTDL